MNRKDYLYSPFGSLGVWSCFPIPKPKKQTAYIGETPSKGANIPLYRPLNPYINS